MRATADAVADDARDRTGAPRGELERAHFERARRYTSRMGDDEFFSHLTAAVLWDIPVPTRALKTAPLHVAIARPGRLSRAAGVRGHQVVAAATGVVIEPRTGLRVTDPATTWATLGSILKDPYDVVAAGVAVVRTWRIAEPLATIEDLAEVLTRGRRVGIGSLRAALPRICTRSASRPETHVRLALIDAGMPEPQLNVEVWRADTYLGAVDLAYPEWKIAIEYEGEHHLLSTEQWTRDIARYDRLRDEGWIVIRVTRVDLFNNTGALMQRIRSAVRSRA